MSFSYPHFSSFDKVKARCEQHMVADHLAFLHGECKAMVREERRKDLSNMYPLLRSVKDGIGVLISELLEHIKAQGLETVRGLRGDNVSKKSKCSKITNKFFVT
jgi:cullin 2